MKRTSTYRKLAVGAVAVAGMAAYGAPALATNISTPVTVTYSTAAGCTSCRTLVLTNPDGSALSGLNMSPGSSGFIAEVQDSGIDPAALGNFSVSSTMSNLYGYDSKTGTWNCGVSIPSGALTLESAPSLINANNLSASLQPIFTISGDISGLITSAITLALPGITVVTNPVITGVQSQADTTLTQAVEAGGSTVSNLVGTLLNNLPINLSSGTGGAFSVPAAPPTGSGCSGTGTGATSIPILNGALPTTSPLPGEVQSVVGKPTVTQMITAGYVTAQQAEDLISAATNIPESDLNLTTAPFGGLLTSIENTLTGTVTGVVDSATTITGNYAAQPAVSVSAPSAAPATYQGLMTVTLTDAAG